MNFLTMQQEVGSQCGLDYTDSQQGPLIKRWINTAIKYIYAQASWPFLRATNPLVVQTVADITTGTVTTTSGTTAITFSSAPTVSVTGYYFQSSKSLDWFLITAHTANYTSATIEAPSLYSGSALTYTVRKVYYSTSATVDRILQINHSVAPYHLEEKTKEFFDAIHPYMQTTGVPVIYMMCGLDSSGYWQFKLWPSPSTAINLYVDYLLVGTDLSADTDTSVIPEKWHRSGVIEGAAYQGYKFLDDTRMGNMTIEEFMDPVIQKMKDEYLPSTSLHRVLRSVDDYALRNEFPLPTNYPNV